MPECLYVDICAGACEGGKRMSASLALEVVSLVSAGNQTTLPSLQPQLRSSLKEHFGYMESLQDVTCVLGQVFPVSAANAISGFCRNCIESVYCFCWCS